MSKGVLLKIFVSEDMLQGGEPLFEWILERAEALGIPGGTAFRAIAGYGRHGHLQPQRMIDLAPNLPVQVQFITSELQARQLLDVLNETRISAFYVRCPVEQGFTGPSGSGRG